MSLWSYITGTTPQDEQDAELAAKQAAFNQALQDRLDAGTISQDDAALQQQYIDSVTLDDTDAAAEQGFIEGAQEGLNNVLDAPGKAVAAIGSGASQVLGGILKGIPWWFYLAAVAALFVWMGGLELLKGRLAKR